VEVAFHFEFGLSPARLSGRERERYMSSDSASRSFGHPCFECCRCELLLFGLLCSMFTPWSRFSLMCDTAGLRFGLTRCLRLACWCTASFALVEEWEVGGCGGVLCGAGWWGALVGSSASWVGRDVESAPMERFAHGDSYCW